MLGGAINAAHGQTVCGTRAKFLDHLAKTYKEAPTSLGVTGSGQVVEVLTSATGSWTIIATSPNGRSCVVAAGEAWERLEPPPTKEGLGL